MKSTENMIPECFAQPQQKIPIDNCTRKDKIPTHNCPSRFTCGAGRSIWAIIHAHHIELSAQMLRPYRPIKYGIGTWQLTSSKIV